MIIMLLHIYALHMMLFSEHLKPADEKKLEQSFYGWKSIFRMVSFVGVHGPRQP